MTQDNQEQQEHLIQSLHRVRSSHDLEEDVTMEVKEGRGTIQKYELIGRPPRTLLLHLQRKVLSYVFELLFTHRRYSPFNTKCNQLVEFPIQFDLREYCLFSQVLVIEWSENIENALPDDYISVEIKKGENDDDRIIKIEGIEL